MLIFRGILFSDDCTRNIKNVNIVFSLITLSELINVCKPNYTNSLGTPSSRSALFKIFTTVDQKS